MKVWAGDRIIAEDVRKADSVFLRFKGFMLKPYIQKEEGLLIPRCNWIHTLFMLQEIDVVYLNAEGAVVDMDSCIKPWRICKPRFNAKSTLELCSGTIGTKSLKVGEVLKCTA